MVEREKISPKVTVVRGLDGGQLPGVNRIMDIIGGSSDSVGAEVVEQQILSRLAERQFSSANDDNNSKESVLRDVARAFQAELGIAKNLGQTTLRLLFPYFDREQDAYDYALGALRDYLRLLGYRDGEVLVENLIAVNYGIENSPENNYRVTVGLVREIVVEEE
jgi:hypothetical protein